MRGQTMMITLNAPDARTLADARQWFVDGKGVYVTVSGDVAELHLRGEIVATRPAAEITGTTAAQAWAVEYLDAETATMNAWADDQLAATIEHMDAVEADAPAAEIREQGAALLSEAAELEAQGTEAVRYPRMRNGERRGWWTCEASDPRHPARRAAAVRRAGGVLAAWTAADEAAYRRYVGEGLSDTDGHFAPEDRAAWSLTGR